MKSTFPVLLVLMLLHCIACGDQEDPTREFEVVPVDDNDIRCLL